MTEFEKQRDLIERLIKTSSDEDLDYRRAKNYGFVNPIKDLLVDCYNYRDMCVWLVEHNNDVFYEFRNADIQSREDFDSDEDFERAKNDCLMISEDGEAVCMSW